MPYRPLLILPDEAAYRSRYETDYVQQSPLVMHDGMRARFYPEAFDHAFYQETDRRGNPIPPVFSNERAERLLWIAECLSDAALPNYRRVMPRGEVRRIILVQTEPYVVVLRAVRGNSAKFLTAYAIQRTRTLTGIQGNPPWTP